MPLCVLRTVPKYEPRFACRDKRQRRSTVSTNFRDPATFTNARRLIDTTMIKLYGETNDARSRNDGIFTETRS